MDDPSLTSDHHYLSVRPSSRVEHATALVLIHGGWHDPSIFSAIVPGLERAGYSVHTPHLPSTGSKASFQDDVAVVRNTVHSVLATGKNVVLVMHSYGALPGCEALEGMKKMQEENAKKGWGQVLKLVFLAGLVMPVGCATWPVREIELVPKGFSCQVR